MPVNVDKKAPAKTAAKVAPAATETAPAEAASEALNVVLTAHDRWFYKGRLYERNVVYSIPEPKFAQELLRKRTDAGKPVFTREEDMPKPDKEVKAPAPVVVHQPKTAEPVTVAGLNAEQTKKFFNVTTPEEEAAFEQELAAREAAEAEAEKAAAAQQTDGDGNPADAVEV